MISYSETNEDDLEARSSTVTDPLVNEPTGLKLREFVERVESVGELKKIRGANWDLEIGALTEFSASLADSKALLFDEITGYPKGYRSGECGALKTS